MESPAIRLLDGKAIAAEMRQDVAKEVQSLRDSGGRPPKLVAVLVGDNPASRAYVGSKARACQEVGMVSETRNLPEDTPADRLFDCLADLNADPEIDGILVQLPLPDHLKEREILEQVRPEKDVDGFHPENVGRLWLDEDTLTPATPTGIMELFRRSDIELPGRHAVVVGRSAIVGKPMAALLLRRNCTVTICHSRTRDLEGICQQADILVAAVGRPAFLGPEHVKDGAVVIDVGINRITDRSRVEALFPGNTRRLKRFDRRGSTLVGDVDFHRVAAKCSAITPVPGGVGPLTVAQLLVNTLKASRRLQGMTSV